MKKIVIIFLGFIVIVSVAFLWKENISLDKQINSEKINAFATTLAVILTSITVYLLFKQNQQQAEAIKAANQPDLFPVGGNYRTKDTNAIEYTLTGLTEPNSQLPSKKVVYPQFAKTLSNDVKDEDLDYSHVLIDLHNIGLGTAKEITASWYFAEADINDIIWEKYPDYTISKQHKFSRFDFLPATSTLQIRIPDDYMACCGIKVNENRLLIPIDECKKPQMFLLIEFYDIYNHKYNKVFECEVFAKWNGIVIKFQKTKIGMHLSIS